MVVPSPCNGLCSYERRTGFCIGCARTRDEIVGWRDATADDRERTIGRLGARRSRLGFVRRLSWSLEEIRDFLLVTVQGTGTWVTGIHGAIGAFRRGRDERVDVASVEGSVSASTARGAISFHLSAKVRAYSVHLSRDERRAPSPTSSLSDLVVMAVARSSRFTDDGRGLRRVGADAEAILDADRAETLYDFGLGDSAGRFGVRVADRRLSQTLERHLGVEWPVFYPALGDEIAHAAPTRVVRSPLGRVEVATPLWSGCPPDGPYAYFLPPRLKLLAAGEAASEMADSYLPCAVHYPAEGAGLPCL